MFVPSLSLQKDDFYISMAQKVPFFAPPWRWPQARTRRACRTIFRFNFSLFVPSLPPWQSFGVKHKTRDVFAPVHDGVGVVGARERAFGWLGAPNAAHNVRIRKGDALAAAGRRARTCSRAWVVERPARRQAAAERAEGSCRGYVQPRAVGQLRRGGGRGGCGCSWHWR
eukprot:COSAG06_NODE_530_length_14570_cov_23.269435_13_plen_169_part_00